MGAFCQWPLERSSESTVTPVHSPPAHKWIDGWMDGWGLFLDFERYRSKGGALKLELYLFHTHVASGLTWVLILESEIARNSVSRRLPLPQGEITGVL